MPLTLAIIADSFFCDRHKPKYHDNWRANQIPDKTQDELETLRLESEAKLKASTLPAAWQLLRQGYRDRTAFKVILGNTEFAFGHLVSIAIVCAHTGKVLFNAKVDYEMTNEELIEDWSAGKGIHQQRIVKAVIDKHYSGRDPAPMMKPKAIARNIAKLKISHCWSLEWSSGSQDFTKIAKFLTSNGYPDLVPPESQRLSVYSLFRFALQVKLPCSKLEFVYLVMRPDQQGCSHHTALVDTMKLKWVTDKIFELCN